MYSILILSPFFFPEQISTGKYNTALAEALRQRGHKVTVLCSHQLYPQWNPRRVESDLPGIHAIRGGMWIKYPKSAFLRRLVLELWFAWHVAWNGLSLRSRFDIVVAVFPPSLFFALASVVLGRRARRVGLVHDLQGIHALGSSYGLSARVLKSIIERVERRAFQACNKLVTLSASMAREIIQGGTSRQKITVCYPFFTVNRNKPMGRSLLTALPPERVHVVYAGALGKKQNPSGLLAFLQKAALQMPSVYFHIFSEGPEFERLLARNVQDGIRNLFFHSLVPEEMLEELYLRSDVQILPQAAGTGDGSMPSKLPNVVVSGCPVFAVCDANSELAEIVCKFDLGVAVSEWEPGFLAASLQNFLKNELFSWKARSQSTKRIEVLRMFTLDNLVNEVLS